MGQPGKAISKLTVDSALGRCRGLCRGPQTAGAHVRRWRASAADSRIFTGKLWLRRTPQPRARGARSRHPEAARTGNSESVSIFSAVCNLQHRCCGPERQRATPSTPDLFMRTTRSSESTRGRFLLSVTLLEANVEAAAAVMTACEAFRACGSEAGFSQDAPRSGAADLTVAFSSMEDCEGARTAVARQPAVLRAACLAADGQVSGAPLCSSCSARAARLLDA